MREIRFRAFDEQQKIMHLDFEFISSGQEQNDWIIFKSDKQQLKDKVVFDNPYFYKQFKIMQCTGLKDKNGKEVYEGDLIDLGYCIGKVVFNESDFGVPCFCIKEDEESYQPFFAKGDEPRVWFEVIGNIYENPELLHVKE